ncbi:MAG: hypothetical protein NTW21_16080 [Verrucomicrobia bacterium]|nr:hypothetical protein [Verrucomicrobiota bacterium]
MAIQSHWPGKLSPPENDVTWGAFTYSGGVDFEHLGGSLSVTEFDFISLLSKPFTVAEDVMLVPAFQYGYTGLDFDGVSDNFPLPDEDMEWGFCGQIGLSLKAW